MKFGLASMSLFPLPLGSILRFASKAGFDFVEVFLLGKWTKERVSRLIESAAMLSLELHFHEVWTTERSEKKERWMNRLLTVTGRLPSEDYRLEEWVPENARPFVAYAERIGELRGMEDVWFQSIAQQKSLDDPAPRLSCPEFLECTQKGAFPVVFDTMHFIEYVRGESGIEHSHLDAPSILDEWQRFWSVSGPQVKEIHFNDFTGKRNLWPGEGTAPLGEFANLAKQSGWDGCVVPEVRPKLPLPYVTRELLSLRKKVESYFA